MPTFMGGNVDEMYAELCREFVRARAKDLKRRGGDEEGTGGGEYGIDAPEESHQRRVAFKWVKKLRDRFSGFIVRRTHESVDCDGKKISGLAPYEEYRINLRQFPLESSMIKSLPGRVKEDRSAAQEPSKKRGHQKVRGCSLFLF
jgi:hypothetical protein